MSQKDERDRELTGPRPERTTAENRHQMNFRVEPNLFVKLVALALIEDGINKHEKGAKAGHVSTNAQLHHILEVAVTKYENEHGAIPAPDDETGIARHVRARTKA